MTESHLPTDPSENCAVVFVCVCRGQGRGENPWGVSYNLRREEGHVDSVTNPVAETEP